MEVAALIPALDEGPRIALIIQALQETLPRSQIVVVDGGSTDQTVSEAQRAGAIVIKQDGRGYAGALRTGYRYLVDQGFDRMVQLDADGQHPPHRAGQLLSALGEANMVIASRAGTQSPGPLSRRAGNALLAGLVRQLTKEPLHDVTSGFWALDRRALTLLADAFPTDVADANIRVLVCRLGLHIQEIPISMSPREGGDSMHDGLSGIVNFYQSLRAMVREARCIAPPELPVA